MAWGLAFAKASAKLAEAPPARRRPTPTPRAGFLARRARAGCQDYALGPGVNTLDTADA
jgi:hypothetical protein